MLSTSELRNTFGNNRPLSKHTCRTQEEPETIRIRLDNEANTDTKQEKRNWLYFFCLLCLSPLDLHHSRSLKPLTFTAFSGIGVSTGKHSVFQMSAEHISPEQD